MDLNYNVVHDLFPGFKLFLFCECGHHGVIQYFECLTSVRLSGSLSVSAYFYEKCTFKQYIIIKIVSSQDNAPREVSVGREHNVPIRDVVISDTTGKIRVGLWRNLAASSITTGSFITVTNCNVFTVEATHGRRW